MRWIGVVLILLLVGCTHRPAAPTGLRIVDPSEPFSVCEPKRGEDQDETRRMQGNAFNDVEHGCL